ncbi:MAG: glycosyltransferase family A protein [Halobacteria archaeon]|nr:glycosyltransferase family A protein [Halobacteria archaeon]
MGTENRVSFVVPAKNEEDYIGDTLKSIRNHETNVRYEISVVDGGSTDSTPEIAEEFGANVYYQDGGGIGRGRHIGACRSSGNWLAFIDADTVVVPRYLDTMLSYVEENALVAGSSLCDMVGVRRAKIMEGTINHVFSRLSRPILPGFNFFVDSDTSRQEDFLTFPTKTPPLASSSPTTGGPDTALRYW